MNQRNLSSAYEAKKYEKEIYKLWEKSSFFKPEKLAGLRKKSYTIVIPPPNITGCLHMGHALNSTIQDILIRFYRMAGYKTLWLPGTDHAGIATQNVVEKELKKEGLTRHQLGREKFVKRVWQWVNKYGNLIIEQLKRLGCSCDWSRQRFTLDKEYVEAVKTAFIHYYKKGLIYHGPRIINWCPRCTTAISDIEVKYREEKGKLWYIRYKLKAQNSNLKTKYIVVATTRPETMLGDTAVAVNPKDERYKDLIGQKVILPLVNREIPIISHHLVDQEFGTGAVKITPAHDATDWQIGKEKKLEIINVIGPDGKMTEQAGKYAGLSVLEAREKIIKDLESLGLLEKEGEEYTHNLTLCDRCDTPIEPQISTQWFLKMKELAKPAIEVVKRRKIKIIPERYRKIYLDWLNRVEDWCISRQLWWGHRLPVFFCQKKETENSQPKPKITNSNFVVSIKQPKKCPFCGKCKMKQSEDVLDTWFSSALWPFATLGWPEKTKDLKNFYPTDFLSTAQEILYLWVARMVFSSLEFIGKIPFKNVYVHSTVLAISGKRMSKSLGTGIDPLKIAEKYGADAVLMGLIYQITREQQSFKFDERVILSARNFINKLWNISRFVQIQNSKFKIQNYNLKLKTKPLTLADRWILSRLNTIIASITEKIKNYQLGEAARELYDFVWHEFADWYIEVAKIQIINPKFRTNTIYCLKFTVNGLLKLLHPFIPFVTETIWQQFNNLTVKQFGNLLIVADWPRVDKKLIDKKAEQEFEKIKNLIIEIRNRRQAQKLATAKTKNFSETQEASKPQRLQLQEKDLLKYKLKHHEKVFKENKEIIEKLTQVKLSFL